MTSAEIRTQAFEAARKGYRTDEVDAFLQQIAGEFDKLTAEKDAAVAAKAEVESKMYVLAQKVEEYREQEDLLKTALINAQRMGETVVKEAKQKADQMLRDATGQAELLRQRAEQETDREREVLESMVAEVARFKATILNLYKQHIESLSALEPPIGRAEDALDEVRPRRAADEEAEDEEYLEEEDAEIEEEDELIEEDEEELEDEAAEEPAPEAGPPKAVNLFEGVPIDGVD